MNFASSVVDALPADRLALIELTRDGTRRTWTFGEVSDRSARLAGTFVAHGVRRGDAVLTLIGNRPEWVFAMVACFRLGAVVLPCNEQLRSGDLRRRLEHVGPKLVIVDERNLAEIEAADPDCSVLTIPDDDLFAAEPAPTTDLREDDPCLITFTSGSAGEPKGVVHVQRYLSGQSLQADNWLGVREDDLVWCTAASGWSKSARNVFIAPWLRGAAALLHDGRFDPQKRIELIAGERVTVLCMAPTEYRVIGKHSALPRFPALREMVAAGEALNPEVLEAWHSATGLWIRDGYGQTETGQLTGNTPAQPARAGSMGRPLPGVRAWVEDGELVVDPATVPTFFLGYLGEDPVARNKPWHTGDRVHEDEEGFIYFDGRADDIIISSGYRIGPFEVESALLTHPAVSEAAALASADEERGSIVRAVVVLRETHKPSDELIREIQEHVKSKTAPYKYPRIVEFADELPRTTSGKLKRAMLRAANDDEKRRK